MTSLNRVRMAITGLPGGPGVATFYTLDLTTFRTSLFNLYANLRGVTPPSISFQSEAAGDIINSVNGEITGAWAQSPAAVLTGTGTGNFAAPAGLHLAWETGTILDGRRVRGRTFVVPIASAACQADGTLDDTARGVLATAGQDFVDAEAGNFVIWHRPFPGAAAVPPRPARPAHDGSHAVVTSCHIPDRVSVLRSRRQ